jgi:hypothetical protein
VILAAAIVGLSHIAAVLGVATHMHGVREGYRPANALTAKLAGWVTLESMVTSGVASVVLGLGILAVVLFSWEARHFERAHNIFPAALGVLFITLGAQNFLGGFMLAIIGGHQAKFLALEETADRARAEAEGAGPVARTGA